MYFKYNLKVKYYNDFDYSIKYYSYDIYKNLSFKNNVSRETLKNKNDYNIWNLYRTRSLIFDYCISNDFDYFVTLTFDYRNSTYSHDDARRRLRNWLNNQRKLNPNMKYIFVPEFHKESGHLHFHGLVSCVQWNLINSGHTTSNGSIIYNIGNAQKLGFSTLTYIENKKSCSNYITKYITKDIIKEKGKRRFWTSHNLRKPIVNYYYRTDFDVSNYFPSKNFLTYSYNNIYNNIERS